jgi:Zn-dependent protease
VTLLIAILCVAVGILSAGGHDFWEAMRVRDQAHTSGILALVAWLASINLLILAFNLIPAFPLDGGRVARSIAWKVTGDRNRATRGAARLGQGFSYLFIAIGILFFLRGDLINGVWLGLIGFILLQSARGAVMQPDRGDPGGGRDG